jgi:hypothetical protein
VPREPKRVDYHSLPNPVVSKKIKDALEPLKIHGIQLIPVTVQAEEESYPYWLLHVHTGIACIDQERSDLWRTSRSQSIIGVNKLALDRDVLKEIPQERRRIFVLDELPSTHIVDGFVKQAILSVKPEGVRFFPAEGWGMDSAFSE